MKKDTDTMLKIYQVWRQLAKMRDKLVRNVETQKGIGPKIGAPIYDAVNLLELADDNLEFLLDRWEGYLPPDVDEDGEPYSDVLLIGAVVDELTDARSTLDQFRREDETVERAKGLIIASLNVLEGVS